jgi:hypothetical protein
MLCLIRNSCCDRENECARIALCRLEAIEGRRPGTSDSVLASESCWAKGERLRSTGPFQ